VRSLLWPIVILAAVLRLFPIWFGLPYPQARPDEEVAIGHAVTMLQGDLNPHFFHWPSLIFYAFALLFTAATWVQRAFQLDGGLTSVEQVLLARGSVALAGTLTVLVLFSLGRRVVDTTTGLTAAAFLAVAVLHVRESHFAMTDVVMTFLVTLSLTLLLRAFDAAPGTLRLFAAAGLTGGLAASTKYSAGAVLAAMAVAQVLLWRNRQGSARVAYAPSVLFVCFFAAGFILATPYALLDFQAFFADLRFDFTHLARGHEGVDLGPGWIRHLTHSLPYGVGLPVFLAGIVGAVPIVRYYPQHALIVGGFFTVFYAVFGSGYTVFFRYILPLIPLVCLLAAVAVRHVGTWVARHTGLSPGVSCALLAGLIAAPSVVNSIWLDLLLARTDTRVLAAQWLDAHVTEGESVLDAGRQYTRLRLKEGVIMTSAESPPADWLVLHDSRLKAYAATPPRLLALAAERYELAHAVHGDRSHDAVYDLQDAFFLPIAGFREVERPGPVIRIYRLKRSFQFPAASLGVNEWKLEAR
jgi:4-amino-4-deoxy-L-arabinose transferase-like glycosyltransferase